MNRKTSQPQFGLRCVSVRQWYFCVIVHLCIVSYRCRSVCFFSLSFCYRWWKSERIRRTDDKGAPETKYDLNSPNIPRDFEKCDENKSTEENQVTVDHFFSLLRFSFILKKQIIIIGAVLAKQCEKVPINTFSPHYFRQFHVLFRLCITTECLILFTIERLILYET